MLWRRKRTVSSRAVVGAAARPFSAVTSNKAANPKFWIQHMSLPGFGHSSFGPIGLDGESDVFYSSSVRTTLRLTAFSRQNSSRRLRGNGSIGSSDTLERNELIILYRTERQYSLYP